MQATATQASKLELEQRQVLAELARLNNALKMETSSDEIDIASEMIEYKMIMTRIQNQKKKLREIDEALEEARQGRYGVCQSCAKPIDPERLEILPETKYCMQCKMIIEKKY